MARDIHDDRIKDDEYVRKVRRYKPSTLVPLIARVSARFWQNQSWLDSPYKKFTPWALADIARVSLVMGNEHRDTEATEADLLACADAYGRIADPSWGRNQTRSMASSCELDMSSSSTNSPPRMSWVGAQHFSYKLVAFAPHKC
jgi:hypothetical protein